MEPQAWKRSRRVCSYKILSAPSLWFSRITLPHLPEPDQTSPRFGKSRARYSIGAQFRRRRDASHKSRCTHRTARHDSLSGTAQSRRRTSSHSPLHLRRHGRGGHIEARCNIFAGDDGDGVWGGAIGPWHWAHTASGPGGKGDNFWWRDPTLPYLRRVRRRDRASLYAPASVRVCTPQQARLRLTR